MDTGGQAKQRRFRLRFGLGSLFALILIFAVLLAWWIDHRRLVSRIELYQIQLDQVRQGAAEEVTRGARLQKPKSQFRSAPEFLLFLRTEKDWYKFDAAVEPFLETSAANGAVEPLLALLNDQNPQIRYRSASALGRLKRRRDVVVPALIRQLHDPHTNVRWHAACALGEFGKDAQDAIPRLREQMMDDESPVATFSAMMLRKIDPTVEIGPRLAQLLTSKHRENRWRAVMELPNHLDARHAEAALTAMFEQEKDAEIRQLIAAALNRAQR